MKIIIQGKIFGKPRVEEVFHHSATSENGLIGRLVNFLD